MKGHLVLGEKVIVKAIGAIVLIAGIVFLLYCLREFLRDDPQNRGS